MPFYEKGDVRLHYHEASSVFPLSVSLGEGLHSTVSLIRLPNGEHHRAN
jgi:hypothetical protein